MMNIKSDIKRITLLGCSSCILASSLTLSSCASMNDRDKTVAQAKAAGTTGGALAGGGIGYVIAKIFGFGDRETAVVTAAGALWGAAIGYKKGTEWGESVVRQKEAYARTEDYIVANIDQTNKRISMLNSENKRLLGQISTLKSQRNQLAKSQTAAPEFNNEVQHMREREEKEA